MLFILRNLELGLYLTGREERGRGRAVTYRDSHVMQIIRHRTHVWTGTKLSVPEGLVRGHL